MSDKLYIGKVGKSVGLKGENRLILATDFPEQFKPGASFETKKGVLTVASFDSNRSLIRFENVSTPEEAKKLTNLELYTTLDATKAACDLEEGEFYWFDIIGLQVFEDAVLLGVVREIERIGTTDYLLVDTDKSLTDQKMAKTFMIPYIDPFIVETDLKKGRIEVEGAYDILEAS